MLHFFSCRTSHDSALRYLKSWYTSSIYFVIWFESSPNTADLFTTAVPVIFRDHFNNSNELSKQVQGFRICGERATHFLWGSSLGYIFLGRHYICKLIKLFSVFFLFINCLVSLLDVGYMTSLQLWYLFVQVCGNFRSFDACLEQRTTLVKSKRVIFSASSALSVTFLFTQVFT